MDHNFYTWPWNETIYKSSYTQENYVLATEVLLLCFVYFFRKIQIENCRIFCDTTCVTIGVFLDIKRHKIYN